MNFRLTAALFAVVTLLLLGLLASVLTHDPKAEVGAGGRAAAPLAEAGLAESDVAELTLTRTEPSEAALTFAKTEAGTWVQTAPTKAKLDQNEVAAVVRELFRLKATPFAELTQNLTAQGLNPPTLTATLKGLGQALTLNFGTTTAGGSEKAVTFVSTSANPERPFAVRRADLSALFKSGADAGAGPAGPRAKWGGDYRVRRFLAESRDPATEATRLKLESGGRSLELAKAGGNWRFVSPVGYGRADEAGDPAPPAPGAAFTGVRPLITALTNLAGRPEDFVADADPAATGLGGPAAIRVALATPGRAEQVVIGNPVLGPDGKPATPAQVYAQVPGESGAVKVAFDRLGALRATLAAPQSLRDRDLLAPAERERLDAIDLTVGVNTVKLRRVPVSGGPAQWVVYGGPAGPVAAKADPVERLVNILTRPRAGQDMLPNLTDTAVTGAALQATVKAWSGVVAGAMPPGGPYPAEPAPTGPPAVELALGTREGGNVVARGTIGDARADYKLPEALLNLALTPRLAWIDPKFASFNRAKAESVSYNREGQGYEVKKTGADWVFTKPPSMVGQLADRPRVEGLLDQLAGITAQTVLAEKPTAEQLQRASLDPIAARLTVTVTVGDGAEKKLVYQFGADTEDGKAVYFRQEGIPVLTRADRRPLDLLLGSSLRDRTVYRIDPKGVTRVQVRGKFGTPAIQTLVVERQAGKWVSPLPNLTPDPAKVDQLVALLATPRCQDFAGPGQAKFGTDVTQEPRAIEIVADRSDGPPVSLVFGTPATGNLVYGASSAATEAFTIDPGPFLPLVGSATGLAK